MKEVLNKPIDEISIEINNIGELDKLKLIDVKEGKTKIKLHIIENDKTFTFSLKESRYVDHKLINALKNNENIKIN